jgi:hypothetical protein
MRKKISLPAFFIVLISLYFIFQDKPNLPKTIADGNGNTADLAARAEWMHNRLKDPATGQIPSGIRQQELAFAKRFAGGNNQRNVNWTARGPFNVGGRTRAMAVDVTNDSIILAGSVSGGMWRSVDAGQNWDCVTQPDQFPSISAIAQNTRAGKTDTWYCGTGELIGTSASGTGAYFYGNGMMKSVDGGLSWSPLTSTATNTPQNFDSHWNFVHRIAIDASVDSLDVVYAATFGRINRSEDGGQTWQTVLGGDPESYFTELAITADGVVYATLSKNNIAGTYNDNGIWRSPDGINWTNILDTDTFPPVYERIVIATNPSNENEVYFLGRTPNYGQHSQCFFNSEDWISLWKYTYVSGNGADTGGVWTNLSMNILNNGTTNFDNFNSQGCYNLIMRISPANPDLIIIGGTNLYRSTDGFTSMNNTTQMGGYSIGSWSPGHWTVYLNHHPDQHELIFLPSDHNVLLSANDGGIFRTDQVLSPVVEWTNLSHGYITTQLYTVGVNPSTSDDMMLAGFQDNGNYFINSPDPQADWVMPLNGDGSYMGITNAADFFYLSIQQGKIYKMQLDSSGGVLGFGRIDPIGPKKSDYLFINPLELDQNNNDIMYVAAGNNLWRNNQLSGIPMAGNYDTISQGWFTYSDSITSQNLKISTIAISKNPANIVWYGTTSRFIYKMVDAHTGDPSPTLMPIIQFPVANVSSIAIDPYDADHVVVVFSNYNVYSIFYTLDGGTTWIKGAGNLEEFNTGLGSGPSIRSVAILPIGQERLYFVGTSIGLFATHQLDTLNTEWHQLGANDFGNVVVEMVKTRETDGLVIAATHGKGIYTTHITSVGQILAKPENEISKQESDLQVFPNPVYNQTTISFSLDYPDDLKVSVFDLSGRLTRSIEKGTFPAGKHSFQFDATGLKSGSYILKVEGHTFFAQVKFVKQ